jgi:hypothetical protein
LDGNTMFNMSAIGLCYDIKNVVFAAFKGDDSAILCERIEPALHGLQTMKDVCGYKIKEHRTSIMEYIANIITPDGLFFPDVIRRVGRLLSKVYTHDKQWDEQKLSIADCLDVFNNATGLEVGCEIAARFYQNFNLQITPSEVKTLLIFLRNVQQYDNIDHIPTKLWEIRSL